jgi:prepilin-type N-terminal cleavage/methylation domain-containing protein
MKLNPTRSAFTLIELLIVLGIIGILVGLTLPAVMASREASRRSQCSANLKQLGLAIHSFHSAFRRLPSSEPISLEGTPQAHGWMIYVMPHLEQQQLYDKYQFKKPWYDVQNMPVVGMRKEFLECPASPEPDRRDFADATSTEAFAAVTDYATITQVDPRLHAQGFVDQAGLGIMPKKAQPTLEHVRDGLSHTLLLTESAARPQIYRRSDKIDSPPNFRTYGGAWASPATDLALLGSSADGSTVPGKFAINRTNGQPASALPPSPKPKYDGTGHVYSFHSGCVNGLFADGAVRSLDEETDVRVLARLVTRAGQEPAPSLP